MMRHRVYQVEANGNSSPSFSSPAVPKTIASSMMPACNMDPVMTKLLLSFCKQILQQIRSFHIDKFSLISLHPAAVCINRFSDRKSNCCTYFFPQAWNFHICVQHPCGMTFKHQTPLESYTVASCCKIRVIK